MAHSGIRVTKIDEVKSRVVVSDKAVKRDLSDLFTFEVPGARFMPKVVAGVWDGKIRLYNYSEESIYTGLLPQVKKFAEDAGVPFKYTYDQLIPVPDSAAIDEFIAHALDHHKHEIRDYQETCIRDCLLYQRNISVVPTGSGKSLIIGLLSRFYVDSGLKVLIVVPRVGLGKQLAEEDLRDYGKFTEDEYHLISKGVKKDSSKKVFVSTWQSIHKQPKRYFEQFDVVMGDEVHEFEAPSLKTIMENASKAPIRHGFTGTMKDPVTHVFTLTGLFGPIKQYTTLRELIDNETLSDIHIDCIVLKHTPKQKFKDYEAEFAYIIGNEKRNKFIRNLAWRESKKGNVLVLFQRVESHGKLLFDMISQSEDVETFYVHGKVGIDERDDHRKYLDTKRRGVIGVVSSGTFSMGTNMTNVSSIILGSPSKSKTKLLQTIGRGVRRSDDFQFLNVFDLADDFRKGKSKANYSLSHFLKRVEQYDNEQLDYTLHNLRY